MKTCKDLQAAKPVDQAAAPPPAPPPVPAPASAQAVKPDDDVVARVQDASSQPLCSSPQVESVRMASETELREAAIKDDSDVSSEAKLERLLSGENIVQGGPQDSSYP